MQTDTHPWFSFDGVSNLLNLQMAGPASPVRNEACDKQSPVLDQSYRSSDTAIWNQPGLAQPTQLIPCDWQFHQNKRQKRSAKRLRDQRVVYRTMPADVDYDVAPLSPPIRRTAIRVGDEPRMRKYYEKAFEAFQQLNCRVIAKAFIKLVEPRKQVNHPYNGRKSASGSSPEQRVDPELTKPKWWPTGVTHKEPDHLLKAGRKVRRGDDSREKKNHTDDRGRANPTPDSHSPRTPGESWDHSGKAPRSRPRREAPDHPGREIECLG